MAHVLVAPGQRLVLNEARPQRLRDPQRRLHQPRELEDRDRRVSADVDHLAPRLRRPQRPHECLHRVFDVGERSRLHAVAVDLDQLAAQQRLVERHHRPAPPRKVVVRSVNVEQAQDRRPQLPFLRQRQHHVLVVELRGRIRPPTRRRRPQHDRPVLDKRHRRVPIHIRRRRQHQIRIQGKRDARGRVHSRDVRLQCPERAAVTRNLQCGKVHDRVAAVEDGAQSVPPARIERLEAEAGVVEAAFEIRERAHRQVVDPDHFEAFVDKARAEMRADEPCGTRDPDARDHETRSHTSR